MSLPVRALPLVAVLLLVGCPDEPAEPCAPACEDRQCGDDGCGGECGECEGAASCEEGVCVAPQPTCYDGLANGEEVDIDCGGPCPKCQPGMRCRTPADCLTAACIYGICVSPTCGDQIFNGQESDVDCGGPACTACLAGRACNGPDDCASRACRNNLCVDCLATEHACHGECSANDSPLSCGSLCEPCPTPGPNGAATCVNAACGLACNGGFHLCGGQCVAESAQSCGPSCVSCPSPGANGDAVCTNDACGFACDAGFHVCGAQCVPESIQSCGPACQPCPSPGANGTATCVNHTCGVNCQAGLSVCGSLCVDLRADEENCGSCDNRCSANKSCEGSACTCSLPSEFVAGTPVANVRDIEDVAVADFNLDGHLDLATGTWNGVSVLPGRGDGTFGAPIESGAGSRVCMRMISTDLDANGRPDLVCVSNQNDLSPWIGAGDGTFTAGTEILGDRLSPLAAADFNGDGRMDVAAAQMGKILVHFGNGSGGFGSTPAEVTTADYINFLAAADLNGDGRADLVATAYGAGTVWLATGTGAFSAGTAFPAGTTSHQDVAATDFNGDGRLDLAVALLSSGQFGILIGNGNGSFQPMRTYAAGSEPVHLEVADFDTDGFEDVVVVNADRNDYGTESMSFFRGKADGTFHPARSYPTNAHPLQVMAGDFDENGAPDVAIVDSWGSTMDLYLGVCN